MGASRIPDSIAELVATPESEKKQPVLASRRAPVLHLALPLAGSYSVILAYRKIVSAKAHHSIGWLQTETKRINTYKDQAKHMRDATRQCLVGSADAPAPGLSFRDWEDWLGRWDVIADLDAFFAPHLIEAYKGSKVVIVERDVEAWVKDMDELLIKPLFSTWGHFFARFLEPVANRHSYWATRQLLCAYFQADTRETMLKNMRGAYESHYNTIRSKVPAERLLEYQPGSGWAPLCAFLGVPVPDCPFPEEDETAVLKQLLRELHQRRLFTIRIRLVFATMLMIGIALGVWAYLRYT
ncbi:uncharacterized protein B0I36DRAFT_37941 [Microdochium trichocladiopsis]|uniref:Efflux pump antibiotic resistance protein n=1 Tax=Microdochium trichocladiopsis TaxID=1682393 RepID=A0A9P9BN04_9PEZI|nr:uncharacterized protein B0I36DRAFT_37941 [Microdochium trichocladiopsis]KAH7018332.1 hypothetical protein B0I36DRAFT_37941 [Microdochium trichocladiopsis]